MSVFNKIYLLLLVLFVNISVFSVFNNVLSKSLASSEVNVRRLWYSFGHSRSKRGYSDKYFYKIPPGPVFDSGEYESDTPPPDYGKEIYLYPTPNSPLPPPESKPKEPPPGPLSSYGAPPSWVTEPPKPEADYPYPPAVPDPMDLMPSKELLHIAEKHISHEMQKSKPEKAPCSSQQPPQPPATSYGIPMFNPNVSAISPPSTSYGVPYEKVPPPMAHSEMKTENTTKSDPEPPSRFYGVPDLKIEQSFSNSEANLTGSASSTAEQEAKPYNLINSSYGAPQKSVPILPQGSPSNILTRSIKPDSIQAEGKSCGKYVLVPMEEYITMNYCLQKSVNFVYNLNNDGTLTKA